MKEMKNKLVALLFPNRCPFCRKAIPAGEDFCVPCAGKLPQITYQRFAVGGVPCSASLPYQDEYAKAIKTYKIGRKDSYTHGFALLLARAAARSYDMCGFDCITCVPLYVKDSRRFRHAERLARECAALTGIPYVEVLEKHRKTAPQHVLDRNRRHDNVKGAFRVPNRELTRGKRVLLIDDVITTGSTLGECARVLKKSGCRSVACATVCTTLL